MPKTLFIGAVHLQMGNGIGVTVAQQMQEEIGTGALRESEIDQDLTAMQVSIKHTLITV